MAHIRRLLDIVACTTSFGSSTSKLAGRPNPKESGLNDTETGSNASATTATVNAGAGEQKPGAAAIAGVQKSSSNDAKTGDCVDPAVSMCPPPRLGQFYDFFSFSHLTPPLHCELVVIDIFLVWLDFGCFFGVAYEMFIEMLGRKLFVCMACYL